MLRVVVAPLRRRRGSVESRCTHDVPIKRISKPYGHDFYRHAVSRLLCSSAVCFEACKAWYAMQRSSRRTGAVTVETMLITSSLLLALALGLPFLRLCIAVNGPLRCGCFCGGGCVSLFPAPSLSAHLEIPSGTLLKTPGTW